MEKDKGNKKKPLKLSSTGRLQIRKNLGPSGDKARSNGNKKTIQIVFKNKNNQQKSSSTRSIQSNNKHLKIIQSSSMFIQELPERKHSNTTKITARTF